MAMTQTYVEQSIPLSTPACDTCGMPTRIYGIEPHPRLPHTDVNTYVCDACDSNQVLVVPLPRKRA
jgi:hypothetical protein